MGKILWLIALCSFAFNQVSTQDDCLLDDQRIDCYMVDIPSQLGCQAKGCIWCPPSEEPNVKGTPSCYLPPSYGYEATESPVYGPDGFNVTLRRATNITYYGHDSPTLLLQVEFHSDYRLRIKITDDSPRWEVPLTINPPQGNNTNQLYEVELINSPVFGIRVTRKSTGAILFDTSLGGLTFSDQYLQLTTTLPSKNLFGIGENEQMTFKHDFSSRKTWPLFTRDQPPQETANMYGVHPVYTVVEESGDTHSVLFLNSNAQELVVIPTPGIVYRTIGGIFDIYIFMGPSPENAAQQYSEAVGKMEIPPYWSLGFHLCKYNYGSLENVQGAVNRTRQYGIPHDVQFIDSDLMERELDFTLSQERYSQLPNYIQELHEKGMKFITIIDPGISNAEITGTYPAYDLGNVFDVWIKKQNGEPVQGKVWPVDPVQYPDFTKNATLEYWIELFLEFKKLIDYDGIWIDMNEPVNFASGDLFEGCEINNLNTPPYIPHIQNRILWDGTLCPDHVDSISTHYNTHSMYGWFEAIATKTAMLEARPGNRSFILSRSTFIGSGKYTAHWLGDNFSLWTNLHTSIIGMLQFNLFAIPLVGADICGFIGEATADMCLRWHQLGAFYPYSRNHNGGYTLQDPGVWGDDVALAAKQALETRYTLLPYLYTLFYYHKIRGDTVARALWHEYPTDQYSLEMDKQFLWGDGVMICPALEEGQMFVDVLLPKASNWYYFYTGERYNVTSDPPVVTLSAPLDEVIVFARGGTILPTQAPGLNTVESSKNPFQLIVPLDSELRAEGKLYFDDGNSADTLENGNYFLASYVYENENLTTIIENDGFAVMSESILSSIKIFGYGDSNVSQAVLLLDKQTVEKHLDIEVHKKSGVLLVPNLDIPMNTNFVLRFI